MGYFSNGSEGERYEAHYCDNCINHDGCWILELHALKNYEDCNNPASILHVLIPRSKDKLSNEKCMMFRDERTLEEKPSCSYCKSKDFELKHEPWCKRQ